MTAHAYAEPEPSVGILTLDPSELVGWGLRTLLARQPWTARCLFARELVEAEQLVRRYEPRVALVSTAFPGFAAGEGLLRLKAVDERIRGIILASENDITRCWGHPVGAWGWVAREWEADRIVSVVDAVVHGRRVMPARSAPTLSRQQQAVLTRIAEGATTREIADDLELSPYTVKEYVRAVLRRLDARNRTEAVRRAQRWGIIG